MISLYNTTVKFDKKIVLDKLSFDFEDGINYAIMGESGCGKTTILNAISNLVKLSDGQIIVDPNTKISYVFQEPRLFNWLTVIQNVTLVMSIPQKEAEEKAKRLLCDLGLGDSLHLYPNELSGGMKQRVSIARALAYEPTVMLLDEPFRALDTETREKVASLVFNHMREKTVIMVTHDDADTVFADKILKIDTSPVSELSVVKNSI